MILQNSVHSVKKKEINPVPAKGGQAPAGWDTGAKLFHPSGGNVFGHNVAMAEDTIALIGKENFNQLEEYKGDLAAEAVALSLDYSEKRFYILNKIADNMRLLNLKDDESKKPYLSSGLVSLKLMMETGIITFIGDEFRIHLDQSRIDDYLARQQENYNELIEAYDSKDAKLCESIRQRLFEESVGSTIMEDRIGKLTKNGKK